MKNKLLLLTTGLCCSIIGTDENINQTSHQNINNFDDISENDRKNKSDQKDNEEDLSDRHARQNTKNPKQYEDDNIRRSRIDSNSPHKEIPKEMQVRVDSLLGSIDDLETLLGSIDDLQPSQEIHLNTLYNLINEFRDLHRYLSHEQKLHIRQVLKQHIQIRINRINKK